jgi:hypothetical protein
MVKELIERVHERAQMEKKTAENWNRVKIGSSGRVCN